LKTKLSWKRAWPPWRTHVSTKTPMSLPVTVKMALAKVADEISMAPHWLAWHFCCDACTASDSCLLNTYVGTSC